MIAGWDRTVISHRDPAWVGWVPIDWIPLRSVARASGGMADALASGASDRKIVGVQVPPRPLHNGLSSVFQMMTSQRAAMAPGRSLVHRTMAMATMVPGTPPAAITPSTGAARIH